MKTLDKMTNVDKANLLHQLFPEEIPALVQFMKSVCITLLEDELIQRKAWDNKLFTFDYWLTLIAEVERKINKYHTRLHKEPSLFADQLFDGMTVFFPLYCIQLYKTAKKHENEKFVLALELFFN